MLHEEDVAGLAVETGGERAKPVRSERLWRGGIGTQRGNRLRRERRELAGVGYLGRFSGLTPAPGGRMLLGLLGVESSDGQMENLG